MKRHWVLGLTEVDVIIPLCVTLMLQWHEGPPGYVSSTMLAGIVRYHAWFMGLHTELAVNPTRALQLQLTSGYKPGNTLGLKCRGDNLVGPGYEHWDDVIWMNSGGGPLSAARGFPRRQGSAEGVRECSRWHISKGSVA